MADIPDPILILAQDTKVAFRETLPRLCFRFYHPTAPDTMLTRLYVFGYNERWQLIGGYTFELGDDTLRVSLQILSAIQFFRKASHASAPRFFPPTLQAMYQDYRRSGTQWQPLLYLPEAVGM